ncbi:somatostatin receptor type 4-like [Saccoglossus kowalevskii]|uniref:Somatostatin receptor type 5-like n=1 Tax=Saccoglossus kowalevskii TaxID=10224 RepID=A0ABM0MU62_SACKO|nr:PREDICTED: somatostatin receptor type 5-like [Saccoglossus kowalevskii]
MGSVFLDDNIGLKTINGNSINDHYYGYDSYNSSMIWQLGQQSQGIIGLTITSFGIPINVAFMIVVGRVKSMRTVTNAYLVNLAVADLLHLITHWSAWLCSLLDDSACPLKLDKTGMCMMMIISKVMQYVSMLTVTVLSLDRYLAVCRPVTYKQGFLHKPRVVLHIITIIWILSMLLTLEIALPCLGYERVFFLYILAGPMIFLVVLFASMITVFVMYSLIVRAVRNAAKRTDNSSHALKSREKQIVRLCMAMTAVYFLCAVPFLLQILEVVVNPWQQSGIWLSDESVVVLSNVATYSLEFNSCINPIIYNALSAKYRQAFATTFCSCQH